MKKNLVRLLSVILTVVMVFPAAVFATDVVDDPPVNTNPPVGGTINLFVGKTQQIEYNDASVSGWDSQDTGVATVSNTGLVTAVAKGTTIVRAYDNSFNTVGGTYTVNVSEASITKIEITTLPQQEYVSGQSLSTSGMVVTVYYDSGDTKELQASSVTVEAEEEDLSLTNLTAGSHRILVKYQGFEARYSISVSERTVLSIECVDEQTKFKVGDSFMGVKVRVNYSDGTHDVLVSGYTVSPETAAKGTTSYTVTYRGKTATKTGLTVTEDSSSGGGGGSGGGSGETPAADYTLTYYTGPTKKTYASGDSFDPAGLYVQVKDKNGTPVGSLSGATLVTLPYTFVDTDISPTGKTTTISISVVYLNKVYAVAIPGLTVTAPKKTLKLSVSSLGLINKFNVDLKRKSYPVGTTLSLSDVDYIYGTDYYGNNFMIAGSDLGDYANTFSLEVSAIKTSSSSSVPSTSRKSSSYRYRIESADVYTNRMDQKVVYLRFYVDSDYYEFEYNSGESGISVYYGSTLLDIYDSLTEALEDVNDVDHRWGGSSSSSGYAYSASRALSIKMAEDASIARYDYMTPRRSIDIDLNGHKLTMYSDTFRFRDKNDSYAVTLSNTASETAKIVYSDLSVDDLLLDKNEKITFRYQENTSVIPGIYTITVAEIKEGGTVTAKPAISSKNTVSVAHGNDVTFTVTPAKDYAIDSVKVKTGAASEQTVSSSTNANYSLSSSTGVATYTMKDVRADSTLTAAFKSTKKEEEKKDEGKKEETKPAETPWTNPFSDVSTYASYYDAVKYVNQNGLMNGMTATSFGPNQTMTRAQFVTTLGRMYLGSIYQTTAEKDAAMIAQYGTDSQFSDVSYNDASLSYAVPYIKWAEASGLVLGYGNGKFGPKDTITHQQMYIIMYRYASSLANKSINVNGVTLSATDASELGAGWLASAKEGAVAAAKYAQQQRFLVSTTRIDPAGNALRYELALLLMQFSKNVLNWQ